MQAKSGLLENDHTLCFGFDLSIGGQRPANLSAKEIVRVFDSISARCLGGGTYSEDLTPTGVAAPLATARLASIADRSGARGSVLDMRWLKLVLAINGAVFMLRASMNLIRPTSFYLPDGAPTYAEDAVRVLGITYAALGLIQLGMWMVPDARAVRTVAGASMLFATGVAIQAVVQGSQSADAFHRLRIGSAAENLGVAVLYAALLYRASRSTPSSPAARGDDPSTEIGGE